jgi:hypothetical protein
MVRHPLLKIRERCALAVQMVVKAVGSYVEAGVGEIVSTFMISSIVSTAPIAAFWSSRCDGGSGYTPWGRNEEDERAVLADMQPPKGAKCPSRRTELVRWDVGKC